MMNDLIEFLRARIAEDEAVAQAVESGWRWRVVNETQSTDVYCADLADDDYADAGAFAEDLFTADAAHVARWDPARVLAECDAKRQLVELHAPISETSRFCGFCCDGYQASLPYPCPNLRLLALPYAGHADYLDDWRP